ncbi:MAG TPA: hypothetical protein PKA13_20320 [Geminicoccaceae bacterium]|nr:hypothetical protein [Geminicoccaceae bacterium]
MLPEMFVYALIERVASGFNPGAALGAVAEYLIGSAENDIEKSVNKLMREPYKTAIENLKGAHSAASEASRASHIEEARKQFIRAMNLDVPPFNLKAAFYTGVCYDLAAEPENAKRLYQSCFEIFFTVEDSIASRFLELEEDMEEKPGKPSAFAGFMKKMPAIPLIRQGASDKFDQMQYVLRELYDAFDDLGDVYVSKQLLAKDKLQAVRLANRAVDRIRADSPPPLKRIVPIIESGRPFGKRQIIAAISSMH